MVRANDFVHTLDGFDEAVVIPLSSYHDCSTLIVTPTRTMMIPHHHDAAVRRMAPIQNQTRSYAVLPCGEVADAYNAATKWMMEKPIEYLFTLEDDNIPPWNAHITLIEAMIEHGYDVLGGLYRAKAPRGMHMAWGDPAKSDRDITCRDATSFIADREIMEVNAVPTGCTVIRRNVLEALALEDGTWFRQFACPTGVKGHDIDFSLRARESGFKLGIHCGVLVGHYDVSEGLCYWPHVDEPTRSLECPG